MDAHKFQRTPSKLVNNPHENSSGHVTNTIASNHDPNQNTYDLVAALDNVSKSRRSNPERGHPETVHTVLDGINREKRFNGANDYDKQRAEIMAREAALSWDFICKRDASPDEKKANRILQAMRKLDEEDIYAKAPCRRGYRGQEHPRFMGDHFLYNVDLINKTRLYQVAEKMPKGAHLHIHFNANLPPAFLIDIAKRMERMFITSNIPLVTVGEHESEPGYYDNFDRSKIQFSILSEKDEKKGTGNLFDPDYPVDKRQPMSFKAFLEEFGKHYTKCTVDQWLIDKLVFHEEEAHGWLQTAEGAWDRFNARTQMMKGLFNYKTAYREYTRRCLQEFVDDRIQYAEIRPNFMTENQLWEDNGSERVENAGIMDIIVNECKNFMKRIEKGEGEREREKPYFAGIKIIYCTPRSFSRSKVKASLEECLKFKLNKDYGKWIAGKRLLLTRVP
jgi:adenosine deaminase CECR1